MIEFQELRVSPDGKRLIIDASVKDLQYYDDVYIDAVIIDTQDTYVANGPSTNPIFSYEVQTLPDSEEEDSEEEDSEEDNLEDEDESTSEEEDTVSLASIAVIPGDGIVGDIGGGATIIPGDDSEDEDTSEDTSEDEDADTEDNTEDNTEDESDEVNSSEEKRIRLELDSTTLGVSLTGTLFFVYVVAKGTPSADTPCGMDNQTVMGVVSNLHPFYRTMVNYMKEIENDCDIPKGFIDSMLRFYALELSIRTGHYPLAVKYWNKFFKDTKSEILKTGCRCHG